MGQLGFNHWASKVAAVLKPEQSLINLEKNKHNNCC